MYLINLLSNEGDVVLDPFGGVGTTAIKAIELNRRFIYNDLNPFAADITRAKIGILQCYLSDPDFLQNETTVINDYGINDCDVSDFIRVSGIDINIKKWYEAKTIVELCSILNMIFNDNSVSEQIYLIRRCAFSSMLKAACSQTDHITYITDNCYPKKLVYRNAHKLYLDQIDVIRMAVADFFKRYFAIFSSQNSISYNLADSIINSSDSRNMSWIEDNSVDLVVTSPPYLCAQDYIKTMRLTNMFFPNETVREKQMLEIGPRRKRGGNTDKVINEYYKDVECVVSEIARVLKPEKYFCLIMGQGSGRITEGVDTVGNISEIIQDKYGFSFEYAVKRNIWNRRVRVGGVGKESIMIFRKNKDGGT